jgi:hypothetical protein
MCPRRLRLGSIREPGGEQRLQRGLNVVAAEDLGEAFGQFGGETADR